MEKEKIVVMIPCYNEESTIVKVIRDFNKVLPSATIYVYDNNSTDRSYDLAKKEKCVVRKCLKQGKGNVVRQMFDEIDADCYLIVDGDDTYPAKDAKKLCNLVLKSGYDMVVGDRLSSTYFEENKIFIRGFGNVLVRLLIRIFFKYKILDVLSGYRAFSNNFVKNTAIFSHNFEVETEITINSIVNNNSICFIPINYKDRKVGSVSKIRVFKDGFSILYTVLRLYIENKPKRFYTFCSLLFIVISLILYFVKIKLYFLTLIISLFLYFTGVILNYILVNNKKVLQIIRR